MAATMNVSSSARIVRVDGFELSCRMPEPIGNAMRFFDLRAALLVRLTDADGQVGWGEDQDGWRTDHFVKMLQAMRGN